LSAAITLALAPTSKAAIAVADNRFKVFRCRFMIWQGLEWVDWISERAIRAAAGELWEVPDLGRDRGRRDAGEWVAIDCGLVWTTSAPDQEKAIRQLRSAKEVFIGRRERERICRYSFPGEVTIRTRKPASDRR
jgi:uncharacterized protein (DUF1684 family)